MFYLERYFEGSKWILFIIRDYYKSVVLYLVFIFCKLLYNYYWRVIKFFLKYFVVIFGIFMKIFIFLYIYVMINDIRYSYYI